MTEVFSFLKRFFSDPQKLQSQATSSSLNCGWARHSQQSSGKFVAEFYHAQYILLQFWITEQQLLHSAAAPVGRSPDEANLSSKCLST
jgi:hypothetical protein